MEPGCTCKYNSDGDKECRFFCDSGDILRFGLYMDACGLPRKVTRCPGFQKLISCEDEFRNQMNELEEDNHERTEIKIEAHCKACRANQIIQVMDVSTYVVVEVPRKITQVVTKVAMTKQHEPSKIVGEDFPVDILWLFESDGVKKVVFLPFGVGLKAISVDCTIASLIKTSS